MAANIDPNLVPPGSTTSTLKRRSRTSMLSRGLSVFVLLAAALFAAAFVTAQENTPESSSTPAATPEATPSAEMPRLELELEELNDSGIEGTVTLYDAGERTIVEFDVEGAGGDHPANISAGVCDDLDPEPVHELQPVNEDGESLTVVDTTLDDLLESEHAIDMRLAPDELGTLIACVNIEGEPELPADGTPAATPQQTPTDGTGGQVAETPTEETPVETAAPDATEAPAETPEPTAAEEVSTPEADGTGGAINGATATSTIALRELNDSGVSGTVTLTEQGSATAIMLSLEGTGLTGGHIAHLHSGTCADPGDYTYTLNPVDADGTSETVVNMTLEELLTDGYMVNVHPSEENWDAWLVCGELTTDATAGVTPTPAPSTGGPAVTATVAPTAEATSAVTTAPTQAPQATTVTTPAPVGGDGTAGVAGTVQGRDVSTLPQQAGVGAMLEWPSDPKTAILWAATGAAIILAIAALFVRRGERQHTANPSRWTRLGI